MLTHFASDVESSRRERLHRRVTELAAEIEQGSFSTILTATEYTKHALAATSIREDCQWVIEATLDTIHVLANCSTLTDGQKKLMAKLPAAIEDMLEVYDSIDLANEAE